jgi:hypothetical protein
MRLQLIAACTFAVLAGCATDPSYAQPPAVDRAAFESDVYPILLRDCGYTGCHGNPERFFRLYGPGRTRLDPATGLFDRPTSAEIDASFDRARSMLAGVPDPRQALLLRKPLESGAGGAAHRGTDALGRNVYASTDDPSWQVIARWAGVAPSDAGVPRDAASDAATRDAATDGAVDAARDTGVDAP